ncbi:UDP-N-acetylmuramate dehydrogenase [Ruminococcus sp. CLA-AA-H200]|uniref:UDP-N-acetylenolpyruvoylglucosamine reductase n=1 Tax=Ruminococcus turbiniformis TaxID=2881258 RepID=A0ABS8G0Q2_9FIRM|nr:UDP-N-acetylmuramate dehydrogenase [Ruminococcus turbiniformis]MCC2255875.1 UDP-N-acetylmuramate dehydrogenase [Ruminococcus turbiniformis]
MNFYEELCSAASEQHVLKDEPMSGHTTFRVGGPADYFVTPADTGEIREVIRLCRDRNVPYYIVGNGSNLLVGDRGYRGVIIQVFRHMNQISTEGEIIRAQAGALLSKVAAAACEAELTGMEFASGIPGTLGGAVRMNAGAYGGEMKQVLKCAEVLTPDGEILEIPVEDMKMGYRTSIVSARDYVVLQAVLSLKKGNREEIRAKMEELRKKRVEKQPLEYGSAGSTFKRPEGYFAGKLIEDAGLRGFRVGNAQVSEKHCGFVINRGGATAAEVDELMNEVIRRVEANSGVRLEPEVKKIGDF